MFASHSSAHTTIEPGLAYPADAAVLTEETLLAMPDEAYMNGEQRAFFRALLSSMLNELAGQLTHTNELLKEKEEFADPADRATYEEVRTLELRTRDRERKLANKIAATIARIDAQEYGYCEETGERIGLQRLLARPTATLTVEAQERHERRERQYRD